jgi:hypothetical protein
MRLKGCMMIVRMNLALVWCSSRASSEDLLMVRPARRKMRSEEALSIQLQMEQMPGYLAARFIGSGVGEEVWRQFELITEHCNGAKNDKLLIDTTEVEAEVSDIERFRLAERMEIFARYGIKVVIVCRPEQIHPKRFALILAQKRGVNVEIFTDSQDAEEWLLI